MSLFALPPCSLFSSLVVLVAGAVSGCGYEANSTLIDPPYGWDPNVCAMPFAEALGTVEIGQRGDPYGANPALIFAPLHDGDPVSVIMGGQGLSMIVLRVRVKAPAGVACVAGSARLDADVAGSASGNYTNRGPFPLSSTSDGLSVSSDIFLPGNYAGHLVASATIGSTKASVHVVVQ